MALKVEIANHCRARVNKALIKRAANTALGAKGADAELSIALLAPAAMRALNKRVLGHDYATDVLSFDHGEGPRGQWLIELAICPAVARDNAQEYDSDPAEELLRYVVHGCLHLVGHDDHSAAARKKCGPRRERIVRRLKPRSASV